MITAISFYKYVTAGWSPASKFIQGRKLSVTDKQSRLDTSIYLLLW